MGKKNSGWRGRQLRKSGAVLKRGRPTGVSDLQRRLKRRAQKDLAMLAIPDNRLEMWLPGVVVDGDKIAITGKSPEHNRCLFKYLAINIRDPEWRRKYLPNPKWRPGQELRLTCPAIYRETKTIESNGAKKQVPRVTYRMLYDAIAAAHRRIWASGLK
jgi:hypothetical protein